MTRIDRIRNIFKDGNIPPYDIDRTAGFIYTLSQDGIDGLLAILSEIKEIKKNNIINEWYHMGDMR